MGLALIFLVAGVIGFVESFDCPSGYIEFQDCCVAALNGSVCPEGGNIALYEPGTDGNYTLPPGIGTTVEFGSAFLMFSTGQKKDYVQKFCRFCPGTCEQRQFKRNELYDYALYETRSSFKTARRLCRDVALSGSQNVIEWIQENIGGACQNNETAWMAGRRGCAQVQFAPGNGLFYSSCDDVVQYVVCQSLTREPIDRISEFLSSIGVPVDFLSDIVRGTLGI